MINESSAVNEVMTLYYSVPQASDRFLSLILISVGDTRVWENNYLPTWSSFIIDLKTQKQLKLSDVVSINDDFVSIINSATLSDSEGNAIDLNTQKKIRGYIEDEALLLIPALEAFDKDTSSGQSFFTADTLILAVRVLPEYDDYVLIKIPMYKLKDVLKTQYKSLYGES